MSSTLVVMRHGQSEWNRANRFTGWTDVGLTAQGIADARRVGEHLRAGGYRFDLAVSSSLRRASDTLSHVLGALGEDARKTVRSWRLNDRHYGALTGMDKDDAAQKFGVSEVREWRRGFNLAPPPLDADAQRALVAALRDHAMPELSALPTTESLRDTLSRVLPLWDEAIVPALRRSEAVLLVGHGNSLRALFKHLDRMSDDAIASIEVAHTEPLVLHFDDALRITSRIVLDI